MKRKGTAGAETSSDEDGRSLPIVNADAATISVDEIKAKMYTIRGVQVMLDRDLASLYGVLTKNLNKAVILSILLKSSMKFISLKRKAN